LLLSWLKGKLEQSLINYTIDSYLAASSNISIRIKKYIEYEQIEAMKIMLQQEYYNQELIFISVFGSNGLNLVSLYRYPKLNDYIIKRSRDFDFNSDKVQFFLDRVKEDLDGEKVSLLLIIYLPVIKKIVSDIGEEVKLGYILLAFDLTKLDNQLKTLSFYSYMVIILLSLFSFMISTFLILQVYKPLQYLRDLSISLSKGEFRLHRDKFWFVEFNYLVDSFFRMAHAIKQQLTMLESLSSMDSLTKLYNRRAFDKFFNAIVIKNNMDSALGMRSNFAIVMLDIDNFKSINDTYGHDVGDKVLIKVAEAIINRKRSTDIAGRYGGEEFVILLDNIANKLDALKFCLDLKNIISKIDIYVDEKKKINITASFGISFYPDDATNKDALIKIADDNLYNSKRMGKNRVSCLIDDKVIDFEKMEGLYSFLDR